MKNLTLLVILSLCVSVSCTAQQKKTEVKNENVEAQIQEEPKVEIKKEAMKEVVIETSMGNITIALYNETPLHRDNFIKLVNDHFYDGILFHRIIQGFMIQAGDPNSKTALAGQQLGNGGPGYTIPAEFVPSLYHKRGAVAAARLGDQMNPKKESSGSQFYIVDGKTYPENEMNNLKYQTQKTWTPEQINTYSTVGGAPFLDGDYTVFGEVIKGMEVVDKIAAQKKGAADRPSVDIKITSMKIVEKE